MICYPALAEITTSAEYGTLLTLVGVINALGVAFGNSANNARLLEQNRDDQDSINRIYNRIILKYCIYVLPIMCIVALLIFSQSILFALVESLISILILLRSYYSVAFRLVINYRKIVVMNILGAIGYALGSGVSFFTKVWVYPFVVGEFLATLYAALGSKMLLEGFRQHEGYPQSTRICRHLFEGSIIANVTSYLDRFLILPILGAQYVSYYTIASLLGKMISVAATPISGVLLTYYSKDSSGVTRNILIKRTAAALAVVAICFFLSIGLSPPILAVLYPSMAEESLEYVPLASLAAILVIGGNMLQPTMLTICDSRMQPILQISYLLVFLLLGIGFSFAFQLLGFCIGALIANGFRFVFIFIASWVKVGKNDEI